MRSIGRETPSSKKSPLPLLHDWNPLSAVVYYLFAEGVTNRISRVDAAAGWGVVSWRIWLSFRHKGGPFLVARKRQGEKRVISLNLFLAGTYGFSRIDLIESVRYLRWFPSINRPESRHASDRLFRPRFDSFPISIMRTIVVLILMLFLVGWILSLVAFDPVVLAVSSESQSPMSAGWRRTADGWESTADWYAPGYEISDPRLDPLTLTSVLLFFSFGCLYFMAED